jgi:hypothetical protein
VRNRGMSVPFAPRQPAGLGRTQLTGGCVCQDTAKAHSMTVAREGPGGSGSNAQAAGIANRSAT